MIKVFKIGGNVVDNDEALGKFLDDFAAIEGDKVLIHGGGKLATRLAAQDELPYHRQAAFRHQHRRNHR